ncbi:MAG: hypothetical protein A3H96_00485 [Acidobacteria bacterium RIFCSPLOWO2_02_FULL_67_36]|nr:MAG: hypothetical protein A3H96_00485 [Acidobacteria bacterium RIFCSPLOWO2_02_FULL_67_36]OFW23108.1 MAG: hypothetical protein A3G21_00865 [Acidobacteria bacterium RIFCSPLOWO2_12_FULL_66_21]
MQLQAMKLCVPLSDAFRIRQDALLPIVNAISFKRPGPELFRGKTHFLECSYNIADPDLPTALERSGFLTALKSGKYTSFACDIGPNCEFVAVYTANGLPRSAPASSLVSDEEYLERCARNAEWLRGHFSGYIQLENLNYFPTGAYEHVCEPAFVHRIVEFTRIPLLLDVGHAMVSAHYMGYREPMDYIRELPLKGIREVQLSRAGMLNGIFEDLHEPPGESELAIVEALTALGAPIQYLTVEYYRDAATLLQVYQSLAKRVTEDGVRTEIVTIHDERF